MFSKLRAGRWRRWLIAISVAFGLVAGSAATASADVSVTKKWPMGNMFTYAQVIGSPDCASGLWFQDQSMDADWFLAVPASCIFDHPDSTSVSSQASKWFQMWAGDDDDNWFNGANGSVIRLTGLYKQYNVALIHFNETSGAATKAIMNWCNPGSGFAGGLPCGGETSFAGGQDGSDALVTGVLLRPERTNWDFGNDTINGDWACKSGGYTGTSCGSVNSTGDEVYTEGSLGSLPWATITRKITTNTAYCGGIQHYSHGEVVYTYGNNNGGGTWNAGPLGKVAPVGLALGPGGDPQPNNRPECYDNPNLLHSVVTHFITAKDIATWFHDQNSALNLEVVDWEGNFGLDASDTNIDNDPYEFPESGTNTLGNKAIPGTTNTVSCWQTFNHASYGPGVSVLNCYRYNSLGQAISNDSYTLPHFCTSAGWDNTAGVAQILVHNTNYFWADGEYPRDGYNEFSEGCYVGTNQSGSAGWYAAGTKTKPNCTMSPLATSACTLTNFGYEGGSYWNSPGVSRDTYAIGATPPGVNTPPHPTDCEWPAGCSIFSRIKYTQ